MTAEKHPHLEAREHLEKIAADETRALEEREQAKLNLVAVNGIIELATKLEVASGGNLCYMKACDLIDEFLLDPMQEQS